MLFYIVVLIITLLVGFICYRLYQLNEFWLVMDPTRAELDGADRIRLFMYSLKKLLTTASFSTIWMIVDGSFFKMVKALGDCTDEQEAAMDAAIAELDDYLNNVFKPSLYALFDDAKTRGWDKTNTYLLLLNVIHNQYTNVFDRIYHEENPDEFNRRLVETFGEPRWDKIAFPMDGYRSACQYTVRFIETQLSHFAKVDHPELTLSCFIGQILDVNKLRKELGSNFPSRITIAMLIRHEVETP